VRDVDIRIGCKKCQVLALVSVRIMHQPKRLSSSFPLTHSENGLPSARCDFFQPQHLDTIPGHRYNVRLCQDRSVCGGIKAVSATYLKKLEGPKKLLDNIQMGKFETYMHYRPRRSSCKGFQINAIAISVERYIVCKGRVSSPLYQRRTLVRHGSNPG
jgi:hypothetical protein